jgi:hypothetical protein
VLTALQGAAEAAVVFETGLFIRLFVSRGCATLVDDDKIGVNTQRNENIGVKAIGDYCVFGC